MSVISPLKEQTAGVIAYTLRKNRKTFTAFYSSLYGTDYLQRPEDFLLVFRKYYSQSLFDLAVNTIVDTYRDSGIFCEIGEWDLQFDHFLQKLPLPASFKEEIFCRKEEEDCVWLHTFMCDKSA
jgi:hypothetical protein